MENNNIKIIEYNLIRKVPEFELANSAKIVYVRRGGILNDKYYNFIDAAIRQEFNVVGIREVTDLQVLKNEVIHHKRGVFHIQYEPNTDEIDIYTTELLSENIEWPVFDIPFPLFIKSKGDGLDIIFTHEIAQMQYDWKDIPSAKVFIQELRQELVNPFPILNN